MRIVHLYKDYHPPVRGGIEQTVERMARWQSGRGHDVTVLCSAHGGRRTTEGRVEGVRVIRVAEWARLASAPLCPAMPRWVGRLSADVWHLHFPNPTGEVSWLLRRPPGILAVTYHSDIVRQAAALAVYAPVVRALLRRADVIMPTSEPYVRRSPFLRAVAARCRVVPLGIDLEPFERLPRLAAEAGRIRAEAGTPLVLFVGRLRYYKGLHVLVDAMREAPGTLVLVGDGPEDGALRERAARAGLGSRVRFAGALDEDGLLAHLAAADVGVLPSTHPSEALGIALIEMMACGIPVISTELGTGTTFVNRDGETGLAVPPSDPAALAAALRRLLGDPALRERFGAAGRRRAREVFSREAMMRGVEEAYASAGARSLHTSGALP